jgi:plasmid stability protein
MKQIITRVDEELAEALKERAAEAGESVNSYVTRLLRAAVAGPDSPRRRWKAAAIANGFVMSRSDPADGPASWELHLKTDVTTPAGYAAGLVSSERDER